MNKSVLVISGILILATLAVVAGMYGGKPGGDLMVKGAIGIAVLGLAFLFWRSVLHKS